MKQIIDGKRYDTEKAEAVASDSSSCGKSDFNYYSEDLYRTPRGRWFLAGEGGARSKYARAVQNGSIGGWRIIPLNEGEAREWLEACNSFQADEALEKYFALEDA
jgi:hypothetical protein